MQVHKKNDFLIIIDDSKDENATITGQYSSCFRGRALDRLKNKLEESLMPESNDIFIATRTTFDTLLFNGKDPYLNDIKSFFEQTKAVKPDSTQTFVDEISKIKKNYKQVVLFSDHPNSPFAALADRFVFSQRSNPLYKDSDPTHHMLPQFTSDDDVLSAEFFKIFAETPDGQINSDNDVSLDIEESSADGSELAASQNFRRISVPLSETPDNVLQLEEDFELSSDDEQESSDDEGDVTGDFFEDLSIHIEDSPAPSTHTSPLKEAQYQTLEKSVLNAWRKQVSDRRQSIGTRIDDPMPLWAKAFLSNIETKLSQLEQLAPTHPEKQEAPSDGIEAKMNEALSTIEIKDAKSLFTKISSLVEQHKTEMSSLSEIIATADPQGEQIPSKNALSQQLQAFLAKREEQDSERVKMIQGLQETLEKTAKSNGLDVNIADISKTVTELQSQLEQAHSQIGNLSQLLSKAPNTSDAISEANLTHDHLKTFMQSKDSQVKQMLEKFKTLEQLVGDRNQGHAEPIDTSTFTQKIRGLKAAADAAQEQLQTIGTAIADISTKGEDTNAQPQSTDLVEKLNVAFLKKEQDRAQLVKQFTAIDQALSAVETTDLIEYTQIEQKIKFLMGQQKRLQALREMVQQEEPASEKEEKGEDTLNLISSFIQTQKQQKAMLSELQTELQNILGQQTIENLPEGSNSKLIENAQNLIFERKKFSIMLNQLSTMLGEDTHERMVQKVRQTLLKRKVDPSSQNRITSNARKNEEEEMDSPSFFDSDMISPSKGLSHLLSALTQKIIAAVQMKNQRADQKRRKKFNAIKWITSSFLVFGLLANAMFYLEATQAIASYIPPNILSVTVLLFLGAAAVLSAIKSSKEHVFRTSALLTISSMTTICCILDLTKVATIFSGLSATATLAALIVPTILGSLGTLGGIAILVYKACVSHNKIHPSGYGAAKPSSIPSKTIGRDRSPSTLTY